MCGICGKVATRGVETTLIEAMSARLRHRGPDDAGIFVRGPVGLGHRRLEILDREGGAQPLANDDGSVRIVFNGEIYNHAVLRRELEARGHCFRTRSDTEVIVRLYEAYGRGCVRRLRGMFAFAIWDERRDVLFLARDRLGQKPLFYRRGPDGFAFASEAKALLVDPAAEARPDLVAMHHYLALRFVPSPRTMFQGIYKLPPAHTLTLTRGNSVVEPYWSLQYEPKWDLDEREAAESLRALLDESVRLHMMGDVPVGAFLSGGIDSSLVVALMARASSRPIPTFSVGVSERGFDELPYARRVAEQYGTDHHELRADPDVLERLPALVWHMDEPSDPLAVCMDAVARLTAPHVKAVIGGDGGDELFVGYDRYYGNTYVDAYAAVPASVRRALAPLIDRFPDSFAYKSVAQRLRWISRMSFVTGGERYAESLSFFRFNAAARERLYTPELWRRMAAEDSHQCIREAYEAESATERVDRLTYCDVATRLPEHSLAIVDRATMAHGLEARCPLLDHEVAEFAVRLPVTLKLRGRRLKHILREVARELLPAELLRRPKQGFTLPLGHWLRHELREPTRALLESSRLVKEGYLSRPGITDLLAEHERGRVDHNHRIWMLLNLEIWHRLYVDGETVGSLQEQLVERRLVARGSQLAVKAGPSRPKAGHHALGGGAQRL